MADERARARDLLGKLGSRAARAAMESWAEALVPESAKALLDELLEPDSRENPAGFNGRAYVEDVEDCIGALARRFPEPLLDALESRPSLRSRLGVFGPVSRLRDPRVTDWLREALESRDGGQRTLGLQGLLDRHDPEVRDRLGPLLADRHMGVAFAAADGLRRWGTSRDLPALLTYAKGAPYGGRERAFDAIEAICTREGRPLPEAHPGARLTTIAVPEGAELRHGLIVASMVNHGDELAGVGDDIVRAPIGGVVGGLDRDPEGRLEAIVLRYDSRARQADE